MELRQLIALDAVVRHGGFTRAAEALHLAQPAVSGQIARLERELGVTVLARTTRRVELTPAGELVLARARAALAEIEGARSDLAELAGVHRGSLHVGATPVLGPLRLPDLLARYHRLHPGVTLHLRTGLISGLLADLDRGDVDVVLGPVHDDLPATVTARILASERIVLVRPPGTQPDTPRGAVAFEALRDQPFVCLPPGSGLHAILLAAASAAGFVPHVPFEAPDPAGVRDLVSAGLGVALLAESAALAAGAAVRVVRLDPEPAHPPIGVLRPAGRAPSPATTAWLALLDAAHAS